MSPPRPRPSRTRWLAAAMVAALFASSCSSVSETIQETSSDATSIGGGADAVEAGEQEEPATSEPGAAVADDAESAAEAAEVPEPTSEPEPTAEPLPTPELGPALSLQTGLDRAATAAAIANPPTALLASTFQDSGSMVLSSSAGDSIANIVTLADGHIIAAGFDVVQVIPPELSVFNGVIESDTDSSLFAQGPDGRVWTLRGDTFGELDELWDDLRQPFGADEVTLPGFEVTTAFIPLADGTFATAGWEGVVRHWDLDAGEMVAEFQASEFWVTTMVGLGDGRIATGSDDKTVQVWDLATNESLFRSDVHDGRVEALTVLDDGRLVSGGDEIVVWDRDFSSFSTLLGHEDIIYDLVQRPDGRLVSAGLDGTMRVWDVPAAGAAETISSSRVLAGHLGAVTTLAIAPDGTLLSGGDDGTVRAWPLDASGIASDELPPGHSDRIWDIDVLPDATIISASHDGTVRAWDLVGNAVGGDILIDSDDQITGVAVHTDSGRITAVDRGGAIHVLDDYPVTTTETAFSWEHVEQLPDGSTLIGNIDGGGIIRHDPETGEGTVLERSSLGIVRDLETHESGTAVGITTSVGLFTMQPGQSGLTPVATDFAVGHVAAPLADGRIAVTADFREQVTILNSDGTVDRQFDVGHRSSVTDPVAVVTDLVELENGLVVSVGRDGVINFWDPDGPQGPVATYTFVGAELRSVVEVPGVGIAAATGFHITLWDLPER